MTVILSTSRLPGSHLHGHDIWLTLKLMTSGCMIKYMNNNGGGDGNEKLLNLHCIVIIDMYSFEGAELIGADRILIQRGCLNISPIFCQIKCFPSLVTAEKVT